MLARRLVFAGKPQIAMEFYDLMWYFNDKQFVILLIS